MMEFTIYDHFFKFGEMGAEFNESYIVQNSFYLGYFVQLAQK
jgi:hypothetical protein